MIEDRRDTVRLLGLGDNVVDRYLDSSLMYPGGNALNVAVYAKMLGTAAEYMGVFGNDAAGAHVRAVLVDLGIPASRSRIEVGENGYADVRIVDGDRTFVRSNKGGVARLHPIKPVGEDIAYLAGFDLVHTSCNSHVDDILPDLRSASRILSYDMSWRWQVEGQFDRVCPHADFATLSCAQAGPEQAQTLLRRAYDRGVGLALATLGGEGAVLFDGEDYIPVAPVPARVIDTLGAGDALIAGTLVHLLRHGWRRGTTPPRAELEAALQAGSALAAKVCELSGAFGYGVPFALADTA